MLFPSGGRSHRQCQTARLNSKFVQTRTEDVLPNINARKPPSACTAITPSAPAATQWTGLLLLAAYGVRRTPYHAVSMGMIQQFFVFVPGDLDL